MLLNQALEQKLGDVDVCEGGLVSSYLGERRYDLRELNLAGATPLHDNRAP
jgi:hypothetical protein